MTRRQIEAHVRRELKRYKGLLLLGNWDIYYGFSDEPEGDFPRARCLSRKWEYQQAALEFYPVNMRSDTKEEISNHVLHELLHVLCGEMVDDAEGTKNEERVIVNLTSIITSMEVSP
jgi:hypothetical protein